MEYTSVGLDSPFVRQCRRSFFGHNGAVCVGLYLAGAVSVSAQYLMALSAGIAIFGMGIFWVIGRGFG